MPNNTHGQVFRAKDHENNVGIIKPSNETVEVVPYAKEQVEHLVDQLIKLQKAYDLGNGISSKVELTAGMKAINKALEGSLMNRLIIKP